MSAYIEVTGCTPSVHRGGLSRYCLLVEPDRILRRSEKDDRDGSAQSFGMRFIHILLDDGQTRIRHEISDLVYEYIALRLLHEPELVGVCNLHQLSQALSYWQIQIIEAVTAFRYNLMKVKSGSLKAKAVECLSELAQHAILCQRPKPHSVERMAAAMAQAAIRLSRYDTKDGAMYALLLERYAPEKIPLIWATVIPTKPQTRALNEVVEPFIEMAVDLAYIHDKTDPRNFFVK